jgi:hypothetical protein
MTMSQTTDDLKVELKKSLELLRTIRDEVRVKMHLAGMEAKEEAWKKLEPLLDAAERTAHEASDASRAAVADAVKRLKAFRETLR